MVGRRGLQTEILLSLLVVMVTATGVLGAVMLRSQEGHLRQLRQLAARALLAEAERALPVGYPSLPGIRWWIIGSEGRVRPRGAHSTPIDVHSRELASEVGERGTPLLVAGTPWEPIRFAMPLGNSGEVAVAWLPSASSRLVLLALLVADVAVFTAFGGYLLRRRLILPLQRLAAAARAIADGALETRAPVEGVGETAEVATAFNEMTGALEGRSRALEKAVCELRESNRCLREARVGLDRAERLAAVGRLAAGVAHEVGNPLGAMLAFLDLARRESGLSESGRGHLSRAVREGEKVRKILRQLLDFSSPPRTTRVAVDLAAVCEETANLVRAQRRYRDIAIEVACHEATPAALADPGVSAQILLNLLLNAGDALVASGTATPEIHVTVRPAVLQVRAGEVTGAAADRRRFDAVECVVEDNGPGIPPEDRERIFDPFFTSKDPGQGTGLGLSNALRFAEELGGSLTLDVDHGPPGAAFSLRFPALSAGSTTQPRRSSG